MPTPTALRHINSVRLLRALYLHGPQSRADLARRLSLTRATVGKLVAALAADRLVALSEAGAHEPAAPAVGRPGTAVRLGAETALFAGVELAVDEARLVLIDLAARVVARATLPPPVPAGDGARTAGAVARELRALAADHDPDGSRLRGICVAVPGLATRDGVVVRAPNLGWRDLPLGAALARALPEIADIRLENDATAFAHAELHRPDADPPANALFLWLDHGIGGGIVADGRLLRGGQGFAGEVGHIRIGPQDRATGAPLPGTFESFAGHGPLLALHRERSGTAATLDELAAAADAGAPVATGTLDLWAGYFGLGLASLASVLDPDEIVAGGPLSPLVARRRAAIARAMDAAMLPGTRRPALRVSDLDGDAVARGAAAVLHADFLQFDFDRVFGAPARRVTT